MQQGPQTIKGPACPPLVKGFSRMTGSDTGRLRTWASNEHCPPIMQCAMEISIGGELRRVWEEMTWSVSLSRDRGCPMLSAPPNSSSHAANFSDTDNTLNPPAH